MNQFENQTGYVRLENAMWTLLGVVSLLSVASLVNALIVLGGI